VSPSLHQTFVRVSCRELGFVFVFCVLSRCVCVRGDVIACVCARGDVVVCVCARGDVVVCVVFTRKGQFKRLYG